MARQTHAAAPYDAPTRHRDDAASWGTFAGLMFVLGAILNTLFGVTALVSDDHLAVDELLFGDLAMWGGLALFFAAIQLLVGGLLLTRQASGVILGLMLAVVSATFALITIGAYPIWNAIAIAIYGLIIYGLSVHGADFVE